MKTWWLSFAPDDDGPCLGVAIVDAPTEIEAVQKCHRLKINPGGQVLIIEIPPENLAETVGPYGKDRLISREELIANGEERIVDQTEEVQAAIEADIRKHKRTIEQGGHR